MKDTILVVVAILVVVGVLGGSQEVRDRAFVQSIWVQSDGAHVYTTVTLYDDTVAYMGIGDDLESSLDSAESRQGRTFFTGHTELVAFSEGSFSLDTLKSMLLGGGISPNCAVVVSDGAVEDARSAYAILESCDRLGEVTIKSASETVKELERNRVVELPRVYSDMSYSTVEVYATD